MFQAKQGINIDLLNEERMGMYIIARCANACELSGVDGGAVPAGNCPHPFPLTDYQKVQSCTIYVNQPSRNCDILELSIDGLSATLFIYNT